MYPRTGNDGDHAGRISGRLHTLIGVGGHPDDFHALLIEARNKLGADHTISLDIEYRWEELRDEDRSALDSTFAWNELRDRADRTEPPESRVAQRIRERCLRQTRRCGRPDDLDRTVDLCREEAKRWPDGPAAADLAWALRDRAWFGGYADLTDHDPQADLDEALDLIDAEVELRRSRFDQVSTMTAELIRVEVLLARATTDLAAAQEALKSIVPLADADVLPFDNLPPARVLHAEALAATGSHEDAAGLARRVYAMYGNVHVFDPARPMLTVAQCVSRWSPEEAVRAAQAAYGQRCQTFRPDSHYALEAQSLLTTLRAKPVPAPRTG
ncbi:hypothetical protein Q0Z83_045460 [Actinoplanes sichuanensis]|nr:hypothetical protein Q0Z83_045460 [Actinoplanes sichuanensis]